MRRFLKDFCLCAFVLGGGGYIALRIMDALFVALNIA